MVSLLKNATIVNEGKTFVADVLIDGHTIAKIGSHITHANATIIDLEGLHLLPGAIDDQVHFREPGLTHKGEIATESAAAIAGGITSFMEMPNTVPQSTTQALLQEKYDRAALVSAANYSFYMGTTNDNADEVLRTDGSKVCGIKIFMGSSTGNMLVDDEQVLERIFANTPLLIATHCEDENTIKENLQRAVDTYGNAIPIGQHPIIRSREACLSSSSRAVNIAKKFNTRLHVLHISTAEELHLFSNALPLAQKRITAEACIHHLFFSEADYATKGNLIKWNPAVKSVADRDAILAAVNNNVIDVIATDHAPHTMEEKNRDYYAAPSGGPLVQHALMAMLELYHQGKISLAHVVQKMCHDVATLFRIKERGFIKEGYKADLVAVNLHEPTTIQKKDLLYKCQWSPFEGHTFQSRVAMTWVNGTLCYKDGTIIAPPNGERLFFEL